MEDFEMSAKNLECVTKMIAATNARENDVRFVFIGNGPVSEEEQNNAQTR